MTVRRLDISSRINASKIFSPTHLTAFPDKYPMPETPDELVDVDTADADSGVEEDATERNLMRMDRKSVRLRLRIGGHWEGR